MNRVPRTPPIVTVSGPRETLVVRRKDRIAGIWTNAESNAFLDAPTYLERAYRTAVAYWTVPMAVEKWSANAVGTMPA